MTAIGPIRVGTNVKMQFESDLALERTRSSNSTALSDLHRGRR